MTTRDTLLAYLDEQLGTEGKDYCPNGLQVEGTTEISRVVTGVSACRELFERAVEHQADAVLVHHGLFWEGDDRGLTGILYHRLKMLFDAEINLIAYHLPLDRHPTLGNNALAARRFGIEAPRPFGVYDSRPLGFGGQLPTAIAPEAFAEQCREVFGQQPLAFADGPPEIIRSAAFVSGAAERLFHQAIAEGYDAFVTGEVSEWVMNVARESNSHFFAAGHYATERLGVRALGEQLADRFGLDVEFIDVPNSV